jgi:hypothetical protein
LEGIEDKKRSLRRHNKQRQEWNDDHQEKGRKTQVRSRQQVVFLETEVEPRMEGRPALLVFFFSFAENFMLTVLCLQS